MAAPRLIEANAAAQRINARLQALDHEASSSLQECALGQDGEYSRDLTISLDSTVYDSFVISEGGFCPGAAHPWFQTWPLIIDRRTGAAVDPVVWLPSTLAVGPEPKDWSKTAELSLFAALTELYISADTAAPYDDPDCHDLLRRFPHAFSIWLDGAGPGLVLLPRGLAYMDSPCPIAVEILLTDLHSLNFSPDLIAALSLP